MSASHFMVRVGLFLLCVSLFIRVSLAQSPGDIPDPSAAKYVGTEVCQGCHEDAYKTFAASVVKVVMVPEQSMRKRAILTRFGDFRRPVSRRSWLPARFAMKQT